MWPNTDKLARLSQGTPAHNAYIAKLA